MLISKEDFLNWRRHPVTQMYLQAVMDGMDINIATLAQRAGMDQLEDRYRAGILYGLQALADWEPSYIEEGLDAADREGTPGTD